MLETNSGEFLEIISELGQANNVSDDLVAGLEKMFVPFTVKKGLHQ